eukprot:14045420-Alexandrium_andersonii.AAC.1
MSGCARSKTRTWSVDSSLALTHFRSPDLQFSTLRCRLHIRPCARHAGRRNWVEPFLCSHTRCK